jgi:hypothetical protein
LNAFPIFVQGDSVHIECFDWLSLIFLCYSYPWALHSFLILWAKIWYLNNLRFFSECTSIFFSISYWSLDLLLWSWLVLLWSWLVLQWSWLEGLRNLRFDDNPWKSSLYIRISIRWSETFIYCEFWLLLNVLWLRFVV